MDFQLIFTLTTKLILYTFTLALGVCFTLLWKTRKIRHETRHLRCINMTKLPFIGHLHYLIFLSWEDATDLLIKEVVAAVKVGLHTVCIWIGPFPLLAVCGAEDVQKVLNSTSTNEKSDEYDYMRFAGGNGLMTAPNNMWRITRSHTNPLFNAKNIEQLIPIFNQNCREMIANLSHHVNDGVFDVFEYPMKTALKSVCNLIFGAKFAFDTNSDEFNRLLNFVERMPHLTLERFRKPWLWMDSVFKYIYQKDMKEMYNLFRIMIDVPMKEHKDEKYLQATLNGHTRKKKNPDTNGILTMMGIHREMQEKLQSFTDEHLKDEIFTLYATGTDTLGATVSTYLLALAQYPDIQDKVYNEVVSVMNDRDEITLEDIRKMQYLEQVCNEVLRLSSVVPFIARKCTEDIQLSQCTVPAGNTIAVMLCGLNMDPEMFPNPDKFDPERFAPENSTNRGKNAFLPFSGGARNCIGKMYAMTLVKMMVAYVLRRYQLFTDMDIHKMKRKWVLTLVSSKGYNIKLKHRPLKSTTAL